VVFLKSFHLRYRILLELLEFSFGGVFLFKGLFAGQTGATTGAGWRKLPGWAAVVLAIFFLFIMACAEGIQVSILALNEKSYEEHRKSSPKAVRILDTIYNKQRNMSAFMVGRQFFVALMMIMLGKCLSFSGSDGKLDGDDWGMPKWFNEWLLQTGFPAEAQDVKRDGTFVPIWSAPCRC